MIFTDKTIPAALRLREFWYLWHLRYLYRARIACFILRQPFLYGPVNYPAAAIKALVNFLVCKPQYGDAEAFHRLVSRCVVGKSVVLKMLRAIKLYDEISCRNVKIRNIPQDYSLAMNRDRK